MGRRLLLSLVLLTAAACTSPATQYPCENYDWYEIGRRDGASGAVLERLDRYRNSCPRAFDSQSESMYRNGRNAGLVEYCTGRNGFELGRMRVTYNSVCPSTAENEFLKSYSKGETARQLELENQRLTAEIERLQETNLTAQASPQERDKIDAQIDDLKKKRSDNDQQILRISQ